MLADVQMLHWSLPSCLWGDDAVILLFALTVILQNLCFSLSCRPGYCHCWCLMYLVSMTAKRLSISIDIILPSFGSSPPARNSFSFVQTPKAFHHYSAREHRVEYANCNQKGCCLTIHYRPQNHSRILKGHKVCTFRHGCHHALLKWIKGRCQKICRR